MTILNNFCYSSVISKWHLLMKIFMQPDKTSFTNLFQTIMTHFSGSLFQGSKVMDVSIEWYYSLNSRWVWSFFSIITDSPSFTETQALTFFLIRKVVKVKCYKILWILWNATCNGCIRFINQYHFLSPTHDHMLFK